MVTLKLWAPKLHGLRLKVYCDNNTTVQILNSARSIDQLALALLREFAYLCTVHQYEIRADHIPGVDNRIPDWLSRYNVDHKARQAFQLWNTQATTVRKPCHHQVWELTGLWQ